MSSGMPVGLSFQFLSLAVALPGLIALAASSLLFPDSFGLSLAILWINGTVLYISGRRRDLAFLAWLFLIPLLNISFRLGWGDRTFSFAKVALSFCILSYAMSRLRGKGFRVPPRAPVVLWLFLLAAFLAPILLKGARPAPLWYFAEQGISFLVFWMVWDLNSERRFRSRAVRTFISMGIVMTVLVLAQGIASAAGYRFYFGWFPSPQGGYFFGGPIGHKNYYGAFQILFIPLLAMRFSHAWRRGVPLVGAAFASLYQKWSVGAGLGIFGALGVCIAFGRLRKKWLVLSILALTVAVTAFQWKTPRLRPHFVQVGVAAWKEAPLLGHGLGSFPEEFRRHEKTVSSPGYSSFLGTPASSHNVYLKLLVEGGVAGLGLFLALLLVVALGLSKAVESAGTNRERNLAVAVLASLVGFVVQAASEEIFFNATLSFLFWTLAALGLAAGEADRNPSSAG